MQEPPADGGEPDRPVKFSARTSTWTSTLAAHAVALIWAAPACLAAGWATSALTGGGWLTAAEPQWGAILAAAAAGTLTWALTHRTVTEHMEELGQDLRNGLEEKTGRDGRPEAGTGPQQDGRNTARAARKDQKRRTRTGPHGRAAAHPERTGR
jgi:hypothetical protein